MNHAEHFAKIRRLRDEAKAAKNKQQVMVWTRELRYLAKVLLRTN